MYKYVNVALEVKISKISSNKVQYCNVFSCRDQKEKNIGQEL